MREVIIFPSFNRLLLPIVLIVATTVMSGKVLAADTAWSEIAAAQTAHAAKCGCSFSGEPMND